MAYRRVVRRSGRSAWRRTHQNFAKTSFAKTGLIKTGFIKTGFIKMGFVSLGSIEMGPMIKIGPMKN
jgi:hypothetical protein